MVAGPLRNEKVPKAQAGACRPLADGVRVRRVALGVLLLAGASAGQARAEAPDLLTYQGMLKEDGVRAQGSRKVNIYLCDAETAGTCYPSGEQDVQVSSGLFRTTYTVPSGADLRTGAWWLEPRLGLGGVIVLSPRERLGAVPYAVYASSAGTLSSKPGELGVSVSTHLFAVAGGSVGIRTQTPAAALDVAGDVRASGWIVGGCANPNDPQDEMVEVGSWCVDKYEASAWSTPSGGVQYGGIPCMSNGQDCGAAAANPIYARSVSGVTPSRATWFQARAACFNAGKELLPNHVWQAAAAGTPDPGATGTAPNCNVSGGTLHPTGSGTNCVSSWGAQDMAGNHWEWAAEWHIAGQDYNGAPANWADGTLSTTHWPDASYGSDGSWNVAGRSYNGSVWVTGLPVAAIRGGYWGNGASAGVFAFIAENGPSASGSNYGFRCGRRR